jgi:hypothetical protein
LAKESVGRENPIFIKREQIDKWKQIISKDEYVRKRETIIMKITLEHFKQLGRLERKEGQKLKKLKA